MGAWLALLSRPDTKLEVCHPRSRDMLTSRNAMAACPRLQGSFVSPIEPRVLRHQRGRGEEEVRQDASDVFAELRDV